jgi:hypothetical protein
LTGFTIERAPADEAKTVELLMTGDGQWGGLGNNTYSNVQISPVRVKALSGLTECQIVSMHITRSWQAESSFFWQTTTQHGGCNLFRREPSQFRRVGTSLPRSIRPLGAATCMPGAETRTTNSAPARGSLGLVRQCRLAATEVDGFCCNRKSLGR